MKKIKPANPFSLTIRDIKKVEFSEEFIKNKTLLHINEYLRAKNEKKH